MHNNQQLTNKGSFVNQGKQGNALQLKGSKVCMPFEKYSQNNNYITLLNLTALDGVPIHSLKEEDYHLVHGFDDSDSEHDFTYHERMPQALLNEIWDLLGEDVDTDFPPKIRVKYPLWMLATHQELMKVSSIFFVGC